MTSRDHSAAERNSPTSAAYWDERYASSPQLWSGDANSVLVEVASELAPGRVLDVGCGEGADAVWLATAGWRVTALDVSGVALRRASEHATDAGAAVRWVEGGLIDASLSSGSFDLVSAQYPVLARTPSATAEHTLLDLVAPGGTLLVVHHADFEVSDPEHHGFNPADYVGPWDLLRLLGAGWTVERYEQRPRQLSAGAGARHTEDVILVAKREFPG